jgi:hypothetical protein
MAGAKGLFISVFRHFFGLAFETSKKLDGRKSEKLKNYKIVFSAYRF